MQTGIGKTISKISNSDFSTDIVEQAKYLRGKWKERAKREEDKKKNPPVNK